MKSISYIPSEDELMLKFRSIKRKPTKHIGHFKFWWDEQNNICAIAITQFTEELREFEEKLGWVKLGGIWKGVKIEEGDIKEARQELLKKLEERGEKY
mgnify:CR=1 FL=1